MDTNNKKPTHNESVEAELTETELENIVAGGSTLTYGGPGQNRILGDE